jgi:hypothetical protein
MAASSSRGSAPSAFGALGYTQPETENIIGPNNIFFRQASVEQLSICHHQPGLRP